MNMSFEDSVKLLQQYVGEVPAGGEESEAAPKGETVTGEQQTQSKPLETVPEFPENQNESKFKTFAKSLISYGGLGVALLILIILYLALVPANKQGMTRLEILFLTLTGKTGLASGSGGNSSGSGSGSINTNVAVSVSKGIAQNPLGGLIPDIEHGVIDIGKWIGSHL